MVPVTGKDNREELSRLVLSYFEMYPEAGDTLEGIAAVWLDVPSSGHTIDDVACALEHLVDQGVLRALRTLSGVTIYRGAS